MGATPLQIWKPFLAPLVWLLYFLLAYIATALACARAPAALDVVRAGLGLAGLAALLAIAALGRRATGARAQPATPAQGFLDALSVLLAGLSAVATFYVALPAMLLADCR